MEPNNKKDLAIFFTAFVAIVITFAAGLSFLHGNTSLTADIATNVPAVGQAATVAQLVPETPVPIPVEATDTIESASTNIVAVAAPKRLPYSAISFTTTDWPKNWGEIDVTTAGLLVDASSSTSGGETLLGGSTAWTNYDFEANVDWEKGKTVSLIARAEDRDDFTYCDFDSGAVTIIERTATVDKVIGSNVSPVKGFGTYEFGVQVYGNDIGCSVNGVAIASAAMEAGSPSAGGVGFISWDPTNNTSKVLVKSLTVKALAMNPVVVPFPEPVIVPPPVVPAPTATSTTLTPVPAPIPVPAPTPVPAPKPAPAPVALTLPYSETNFANDPNWATTWADFDIDPSGDLIVEATDTSTGDLVYLKNASTWSNYTFTASIDWVSGQTFGLIAQYVNDKNYVICSFDQSDRGDIDISLQQYVNGQENDLSDGHIVDYEPAPGSFVNASMKIQQTSGICTLDGHQVSNQIPNASVINAPFVGGIGFTTWDPTPNLSRIIVKSVSVTGS